MLQSFLIEPYKIQLANSPVPEPGEGEILVRLTMVGVCGSDVHMFKNGHTVEGPLTIGHEGIGIIEKVGIGVSSQRIGERVAIEPNLPCHSCPECWSGKGNICKDKRIIGVRETGCFAEYIVLPGKFLHALPESISAINAVAIEPATVAYSAIIRSNAKPGDTIAVIGLGAIGLLVTHIALKLGFKVLVSEIIESKIKVAVEMGATPVKGGNTPEETVEKLETVFAEEGVISLFECAGSEKSATMAIQVAPRGAEIILLGLSDTYANFTPRLISRKGNSIVTSLIYDHPFDYNRVIKLVERDIIQPGFIVSRYFSLNEIQTALEEASKGTDSKIVIQMAE